MSGEGGGRACDPVNDTAAPGVPLLIAMLMLLVLASLRVCVIPRAKRSTFHGVGGRRMCLGPRSHCVHPSTSSAPLTGDNTKPTARTELCEGRRRSVRPVLCSNLLPERAAPLCGGGGSVVVVAPSALSSQPLNPTARSLPFLFFGEAATHELTRRG